MRKYPIVWFYILAFGISWLGMISVVLASRGIAPFYRPYFIFLSIFYAIGPTLAAVIVSQVAHGKTGIRGLLKGPIRWRVGPVWYIVAVLGPVVLSTKGSILPVAIFHGAGNIFGAFITGVSPIAYAVVTCVVAIVLIAVFGRANLSRRPKVCMD